MVEKTFNCMEMQTKRKKDPVSVNANDFTCTSMIMFISLGYRFDSTPGAF